MGEKMGTRELDMRKMLTPYEMNLIGEEEAHDNIEEMREESSTRPYGTPANFNMYSDLIL